MKNILKSLRLHEDTVSMIIGAIVVIIVGLIVVNFFRTRDAGETLPTGVSTESAETYVVEEGDTLWTIAERFYDNGFEWEKILEANELDPNQNIEPGMELQIPDASELIASIADQIAESTPDPTVESTPEATPEPTVEPTSTPEATPEPTEEPAPEETETPKLKTLADLRAESGAEITGDTYEVQSGDNLWEIAERAYDDGFRWTDIANANDLANPGIIHAGNQLTIPRG